MISQITLQSAVAHTRGSNTRPSVNLYVLEHMTGSNTAASTHSSPSSPPVSSETTSWPLTWQTRYESSSSCHTNSRRTPATPAEIPHREHIPVFIARPSEHRQVWAKLWRLMLFVPRLDSGITSDAMLERVLYTQNSTNTDSHRFTNTHLSLVSQSYSPAPDAGDWWSQKLTRRSNEQLNVVKASQNHSVSDISAA